MRGAEEADLQRPARDAYAEGTEEFRRNGRLIRNIGDKGRKKDAAKLEDQERPTYNLGKKLSIFFVVAWAQ